MGLGRTTRFAKLPPGARRVSVMLAGKAGIKALAPPRDLFDDFVREKKHGAVEAFRRVNYRERFAAHIRARGMDALRALVADAKTGDVYIMCMCPYDAPGRACHTYALLDLARELDPSLELLPEPRPRRV